jgi:hypothetical protein
VKAAVCSEWQQQHHQLLLLLLLLWLQLHQPSQTQSLCSQRQQGWVHVVLSLGRLLCCWQRRIGWRLS